ncbi:MAG: phosphoribosylanthranilate isomerase [Acidobacteriota bacterium]|jgi:phosphoribosylanthranilate isomerase
MPTRLKVCCIASVAEARLAVRLGASALGLVSSMPSGPGVIGEDAIRRIAETVPPGVATFLLTSSTSVPAVVDQHRRCRTSTIQLCDRLTEGTHADLKAELPGIKIVQVVHVVDGDAVEEAVAVARAADAILLDSGRPGAQVKELGGTGRVHDWTVSAVIRKAVSPVPLYLAGGLKPSNIRDAIRAVRPFGVDVCSGVRIDDRLDEERLRSFVEAMGREHEQETSHPVPTSGR